MLLPTLLSRSERGYMAVQIARVVSRIRSTMAATLPAAVHCSYRSTTDSVRWASWLWIVLALLGTKRPRISYWPWNGYKKT
jgi:uncharacterized membrane protein